MKLGANDNSFNLISINIDGRNIVETPLVKAANGIFNKVFSNLIEYQIVREAELKKLASDTNKYFNLIPENERDNSKLGLTLKAMEDSQYQLNDNEIRDMFAKLIAKSMDKRFNTEIPPAFSDILKNLSSNEAFICKILYSIEYKVLPLFQLKMSNKEGVSAMELLRNDKDYHEYSIDSKYWFWYGEIIKIDKLTISLLERAGIIEPAFYITEKQSPGYRQSELIKSSPDFLSLIEVNERNISKQYDTRDKLVLDEQCIQFTTLGRKLMDICLS
ncbi:DUF4393 domain-containing protein [Enterococcus mundtii]|uniref:DUF4393 domain-containing protein n=1 Tax=Enterococcus mundtii TaxID=53346 RepID=UPI00403D3EE4